MCKMRMCKMRVYCKKGGTSWITCLLHLEERYCRNKSQALHTHIHIITYSRRPRPWAWGVDEMSKPPRHMPREPFVHVSITPYECVFSFPFFFGFFLAWYFFVASHVVCLGWVSLKPRPACITKWGLLQGYGLRGRIYVMCRRLCMCKSTQIWSFFFLSISC